MTNVRGSFDGLDVRMEVSPTSGDTIVIQAPFDHLYVYKGTTTAALTIKLPASPVDGDMVRISTLAAISAVTWSPASVGPSSMAAQSGLSLQYSDTQAAWFVR